MSIITFQEKDREAWDQYVLKHPEGTIFHTSSFKTVVEKSFNNQTAQYLLAKEGGEIKGIFPLFLSKSFLSGTTLLSVPFGVYGGICADDQAIKQQLLDEAVKLAEKHAAAYIEIRNTDASGLDLQSKDLYAYFRLELPDDPEIVWTSMRKRNRNILRKGIKSGLTTKHTGIGQVDQKTLKEFHRFFAGSQQDLGTPVLPMKFFQNLLQELGDHISLISTYHEGTLASVMMNYYYKDMAMPYYIGYDRRFLSYAPNNFIIWEEIQFCCKAGYKQFDLGRSRVGSGSYSFKKHWGIEPRQLHYEYKLQTATEMPNLSPSNPKYDIPRRLWAKMPRSVARIISPFLIKHLP